MDFRGIEVKSCSGDEYMDSEDDNREAELREEMVTSCMHSDPWQLMMQFCASGSSESSPASISAMFPATVPTHSELRGNNLALCSCEYVGEVVEWIKRLFCDFHPHAMYRSLLETGMTTVQASISLATHTLSMMHPGKARALGSLALAANQGTTFDRAIDHLLMDSRSSCVGAGVPFCLLDVMEILLGVYSVCDAHQAVVATNLQRSIIRAQNLIDSAERKASISKIITDDYPLHKLFFSCSTGVWMVGKVVAKAGRPRVAYMMWVLQLCGEMRTAMDEMERNEFVDTRFSTYGLLAAKGRALMTICSARLSRRARQTVALLCSSYVNIAIVHLFLKKDRSMHNHSSTPIMFGTPDDLQLLIPSCIPIGVPNSAACGTERFLLHPVITSAQLNDPGLDESGGQPLFANMQSRLPAILWMPTLKSFSGKVHDLQLQSPILLPCYLVIHFFKRDIVDRLTQAFLK
jgi:hypothetical protein